MEFVEKVPVCYTNIHPSDLSDGTTFNTELC